MVRIPLLVFKDGKCLERYCKIQVVRLKFLGVEDLYSLVLSQNSSFENICVAVVVRIRESINGQPNSGESCYGVAAKPSTAMESA